MSLPSSTGLKKRRRSSSEGETSVIKKLCEPLQRECGDTFASGNAYVHNGDHLHFHQAASSFQSEVQQMQALLAFPGMHDRYESLREAQDGTYEWILISDTGDEDHFRERRLCMKTFFQWYRTGSGIYWVSGKPGSGKSTLMKYLVEHIGSCDAVSHQPGLVILSFFLWVRGGNLQRSRLGCLKSLLWQLLQNPIAQAATMQQCRPYYKNAWSEQRLEAALLATLRQLDGPVVVFIDGLDEGEDHEHLLDLLYTFDTIKSVKTCVSSRPEPVFVDRLQDMPRLKLHDLNDGDIQCFVKQNLLQDPRVAAMNSNPDLHYHSTDMGTLVNEIERKSEGVFLWVQLVVKDLLKGISNKDDIQTLSCRLERLPADISELYEDMLQRSQDDVSLYKEDISLYLSLVLHRKFDLVEFCFAVDDDLRHEFLRPSILDNATEAMKKIPCDTVKTWIRARTAGLLDVIKHDTRRHFNEMWNFSQTLHQDLKASQIPKYRELSVQVVHRTAHDFLLNTAAGNLLLRPSAEMDSKVKKICFQTKLVCELVFPSLQGLCIGTGNAVQSLNCVTCKDEDILAGLRDQGEKFFNFLHRAHLVQLDQDFEWGDYCGTGRTVVPRRVAPFSSSRHSEVDLAPALVLADRYEAAKIWLSEQSLLNDSNYLSTLLAPLIIHSLKWMCRRASQAEDENLWSLLDLLISHSADVRKAITIDSEESLLQAGEIVDWVTRSDGRVPRLDGFLSAMRFAYAHYAVRFTALCYHCHTIWFDNFQLKEYQMWGSFSIRNLVVGYRDGLFDENQKAPYRLKDDLVLILASASGVQGEPPVLWAISEADSRSLGLVALNGLLPTIMPDPGRLRMRSDCLEGCIYPHILDEILGRSKVVSFAGAMQHMSKSTKTIRTFYENEAKRMALEPEYIQAGWKEWFWGNVVPPTQHANGESTRVVEA